MYNILISCLHSKAFTIASISFQAVKCLADLFYHLKWWSLTVFVPEPLMSISEGHRVRKNSLTAQGRNQTKPQ